MHLIIFIDQSSQVGKDKMLERGRASSFKYI